MTTAIREYLSGTTASAQTERTPGRTDEVRNAADGYVFKAEDAHRLERFLILGTDGGTYYVSQRDLTTRSIDFVLDFIKRDESSVLSVLSDIATNNRAPKNSPSLFVLALLLVHGRDKAAVRRVVPEVVRTGTHLFEFAGYLKLLGGLGRAKRAALADWYLSKTPEQIAYQAVKYRSRNGFSHRDIFRLAHPVGVDQTVGNFILGREFEADRIPLLHGFRLMQAATSPADVVWVLSEFPNLPWESIPTRFLTDPEVWKRLFYNGMGQTALLRNVTRFAKIGAFDDLVFAGDVANALADPDRIIRGRMHPVAYANALGVYSSGPVRGGTYYGPRSAPWPVNAKVAGALEAGFYESFKTVKPANKRTMVSLDVSASMTWGAPAGLVGMNYMEAAAVMAMVTVRSEPYVEVNAFSTTLQRVNISAADSFETVKNKLSALSFGGTDISQPMVYAKANRMAIDTFIVYSDMETWAGDQKPFQALRNYRKDSKIEAKLVAVGLASTSTTVADPLDKSSLNVVGFDSTAPAVIADFSAGRL